MHSVTNFHKSKQQSSLSDVDHSLHTLEVAAFYDRTVPIIQFINIINNDNIKNEQYGSYNAL